MPHLQKVKRSTIVTALLVAALIALHALGILKPVERLLTTVVEPWQGWLYSLSPKQLTDSQESQLIEKVEELTANNSRLHELAKENKELRELLELKNKQAWRLVATQVIGHDLHDNQAIILDRGAHDGITEGSPVVVNNEKTLWAIVVSVKEGSATALPITDQRVQMTARILEHDSVPSLVQGEHGLSLRMDFVPQQDPATENQIVVTAGLEPTMPSGLVIGLIQKVEKRPEELFQRVNIRPLTLKAEPSVAGILLPPN